jgi:hypothetical protein
MQTATVNTQAILCNLIHSSTTQITTQCNAVLKTNYAKQLVLQAKIAQNAQNSAATNAQQMQYYTVQSALITAKRMLTLTTNVTTHAHAQNIVNCINVIVTLNKQYAQAVAMQNINVATKIVANIAAQYAQANLHCVQITAISNYTQTQLRKNATSTNAAQALHMLHLQVLVNKANAIATNNLLQIAVLQKQIKQLLQQAIVKQKFCLQLNAQAKANYVNNNFVVNTQSFVNYNKHIHTTYLAYKANAQLLQINANLLTLNAQLQQQYAMQTNYAAQRTLNSFKQARKSILKQNKLF